MHRIQRWGIDAPGVLTGMARQEKGNYVLFADWQRGITEAKKETARAYEILNREQRYAEARLKSMAKTIQELQDKLDQLP